MANFSIERDAGTDIVTCRVTGFLADADTEALVAQLSREVQTCRRRGISLRLLFDNRLGSVFSAKAAQALIELKASYDPQDRTAVVVSDNLHKLQAKRSSGDGTQIFTSEAAAMAWLVTGEG